MEYVLTTDALSKRYGHFKALDQLTLHVPKGAIYGFVGKNGAGKTTLIRVICGLQSPTSGEYALYGASHRQPGIRAARRRMGAVVETPSIYLDLTAEENLRQQYRILGLPSFEGIPALLGLVGLQSAGRKKARNFRQCPKGSKQTHGGRRRIITALGPIFSFRRWWRRSRLTSFGGQRPRFCDRRFPPFGGGCLAPVPARG